MEDTGSDLTGKAWEMLNTVLETGFLVLGNGERLKLTAKEIASVTQFVASRQALKEKGVVLLDEFRLERTDGKET